jgi:hypothetical protein
MSMTKEQKHQMYLEALKRINPIEFYDAKDAIFTGDKDGDDLVATARFPKAFIISNASTRTAITTSA